MNTNTNTVNNPLYNQIQTTLHSGDIIKNYKTLCTLLNEEIKGGKSKTYQHKEWKRYFDYTKEGQKYIITKVYTEPLTKEDLRTLGNNNIYVENIELLLLNYLSRQEGQKAILTMKKWFLKLGMINQNYLQENYDELKKDNYEISDYQINHFYQRTYQKLRKILFDSLRNLKNRRLIDYDEITMISIKEPNFYGILETNTRPATEEERNIIRDTEKLVLNQLGLSSMILMHLKFKQKEFYNSVNQILHDQYNINYSYIDIQILFTKHYINEALYEANIKTQRKMLNDKIINSVNKQAENIYNKNQIQYEEQVEEFLNSIIGEPNSMVLNKFFKLPDTYLYAQQQLAEYLLKE